MQSKGQCRNPWAFDFDHCYPGIGHIASCFIYIKWCWGHKHRLIGSRPHALHVKHFSLHIKIGVFHVIQCLFSTSSKLYTSAWQNVGPSLKVAWLYNSLQRFIIEVNWWSYVLFIAVRLLLSLCIICHSMLLSCSMLHASNYDVSRIYLWTSYIVDRRLESYFLSLPP